MTLTTSDIIVVLAIALIAAALVFVLGESILTRRATQTVLTDGPDPLMDETAEKISAGELSYSEAQEVLMTDVMARARGKHRR